MTSAWVESNKTYIEWVKPDGGALCCLRLKASAFDAEGVARFWSALPKAELQIGNGTWFGESPSILRLGFGYLPINLLPSALEVLSSVLKAVA